MMSYKISFKWILRQWNQLQELPNIKAPICSWDIKNKVNFLLSQPETEGFNCVFELNICNKSSIVRILCLKNSFNILNSRPKQSPNFSQQSLLRIFWGSCRVIWIYSLTQTHYCDLIFNWRWEKQITSRNRAYWSAQILMISSKKQKEYFDNLFWWF